MSEKSPPVCNEPSSPRMPAFWAAISPPLAVAILCTGLIVEAIKTAKTGRANGDLMVTVCPLLGAIFLAIPAVQAWIAVARFTVRRLKGKANRTTIQGGER